MAAARRASLVAAHANSLHLVKKAMELQVELELQEDHERDAMRLYLSLDRELIPKLRDSAVSELKGCEISARDNISQLLHNFERAVHAHTEQILDALGRQADVKRERLHDLAAEVKLTLRQQQYPVLSRAERVDPRRAHGSLNWADVAAIARADRERLRVEGVTSKKPTRSQAMSRVSGHKGGQPSGDQHDLPMEADELEGPLRALAASLRRPHATFHISLDRLQEWKDVLIRARQEGRPSAATLQRMLELVKMAPIYEGHRGKQMIVDVATAAEAAVAAATGASVIDDPASTMTQMDHAAEPTRAPRQVGSAGDSLGEALRAFEKLLHRALLHRHAAELRDTLEAWENRRVDVWTVVEEIEKLREMGVLPMEMLKLHEHEWMSALRDASGHQVAEGHLGFDAEEAW
eukprot:scaffold83726_cov29-Tisochrysis_lutea.AAC.7